MKMVEYVSIVVVSHTEKIALGIQEMIGQIAEEIVVEVAGGTNDGTVGTSLEKITCAIDRAASSKGVLVFYDMGSAKMNAQFAIEMGEYVDVEIVDAPLVEGAYIAAVKASIGKSASEMKRKLHTFFQDFLKHV